MTLNKKGGTFHLNVDIQLRQTQGATIKKGFLNTRTGLQILNSALCDFL
jgi:hypothetical protein